MGLPFLLKWLYLCVILIQYLAFSCGVVRGALCNLGLESVVTAEVSVMPSCEFCHGATSHCKSANNSIANDMRPIFKDGFSEKPICLVTNHAVCLLLLPFC